MVVMKFGGAVLGQPGGFERLTGIVRAGAGEPLFVVVSAVGATTRNLRQAAELAAGGALDSARAALRSVFDYADPVITELRAEIEPLLEGIAITRHVTPRTLDRILAAGESVALHLATQALTNAGIRATSVDARTFMVTDETFTAATPDLEKTRLRIERDVAPLCTPDTVVVTQGFVGRTEHGDTTTMGTESSNLTAAIAGALLHAREIVIWTDVPGVRSTDPSVAPTTVVRPHLNYAQATLAAAHGLKLLYPTMIPPAANAGVPIRIACPSDPQGDHTIIDAQHATPEAIVVLDDPAVHVLFAPSGDVLRAISTAYEALRAQHADTSQFSVHLDAALGVTTLTLPAAHVRSSAAIIHSILTEKS
jgi:aspartate kinase